MHRMGLRLGHLLQVAVHELPGPGGPGSQPGPGEEG